MLPTFVLTSTSADDAFLASLERTLATLPLPPMTGAASVASSADAEPAGGEGKIRIEYRPARDFYSTAGKHAFSRVKVLESKRRQTEPQLQLEEEIERLLDDRTTRNRELGLEALLNNLSASPLTVSQALPVCVSSRKSGPSSKLSAPPLPSSAARALCSSTCRALGLAQATYKGMCSSSAASSCSGCA